MPDRQLLAATRPGHEPATEAWSSNAEAAQLSEFEFGLIIAGRAFERWMTRCMAAAGETRLTVLDTLVLHTVDHRTRDARLSDIAFILNVEDTHTVGYSLRKLVGLGLIRSQQRGKEKLYAPTAEGRALCERYRRIRQDCLVEALHHLSEDQRQIGRLAPLLRALSGLYDQAARRAATAL